MTPDESKVVLNQIAHFVDYSEAVVIKIADWDKLYDWVESLPKELLINRPNFDYLPIVFSKID